jgi:transposase
VIQDRSTVQSHKRRGTGHEENSTILGLDVHADTIAVAIAEPDGSVRSLGTIANRAESIRKMVKKLGAAEQLRACYEAGPTGYVLYWQLAELGVACEVIAPTLVPMKAGDRVKTDCRNAERLARSHRSGDLTAVWVPDASSDALRDLVRAREAAKQDQLRARHRLSKFLLRSGQRPAQGMKAWTLWYMAWIKQIRFAQMAQEATKLDYLTEVQHMGERVVRLDKAIEEAVKLASPKIHEVIKDLQALRGIVPISAVTIAAELGSISRFAGARQLRAIAVRFPARAPAASERNGEASPRPATRI